MSQGNKDQRIHRETRRIGICLVEGGDASVDGEGREIDMVSTK